MTYSKLIFNHCVIIIKHCSPVDLNNLLSLRLAPNVSTSLLERISELHLAQRGTDTAQAEIRYLETSSQLAFYGLHQFHVRDAEKVDITLGVHHGGIFIFEKGFSSTKINQEVIRFFRNFVKPSGVAGDNRIILQTRLVLRQSARRQRGEQRGQNWFCLSDIGHGKTHLAHRRRASSLFPKRGLWRKGRVTKLSELLTQRLLIR